MGHSPQQEQALFAVAGGWEPSCTFTYPVTPRMTVHTHTNSQSPHSASTRVFIRSLSHTQANTQGVINTTPQDQLYSLIQL